MQDRDGVARAVDFANEIRAEGTTDVVLLGMGGSSLAPEVMRSIIGRSRSVPGPSCGRFHRSRTDSFGGARDRFSPDDVPGGVQVGDDARGEHPQAAFFPSRRAGARRSRSRPSFRADDRPWLEARAYCEKGRLPRDFSRTADGRRPVLGAFEFRTGAGRVARGGSRVAARSRARGWRSAASRPVQKILASSSVWCWASWRSLGATNRR